MRRRRATMWAVLLAGITVLATPGVAAGAELGTQGYFTDDNGHLFEEDIDAIAAAGITKGCNPPDNTRFCPKDMVSREAMAAFLRRALNLPSSSEDHFTDDNNSIFEDDINAIAEAGITKGCNPPSNTLYCPREAVTRGAMAAFLRRALDLPFVLLHLPLADHSSASCTKNGVRCTFTLIISPGRTYRVEEGLFQILPATGEENSEFNAAGTSFTLTANGEVISMTALPVEIESLISYREWRQDMSFSAGTHTLVARWRWNGELVLTNVVTVQTSS